MATSVISSTIVDASGDPISGARVVARLLPTPGFKSGGDEIAGQVETQTDGDGEWSLTLERNEDITPANTFYEVTEFVPNGRRIERRVWNISVPDQDSTLLLALITPPTANPSYETTLGTLNGTYVSAFAVESAYGDGSTDATAHIQSKLDACAAAGGGVVYIPQGTYMVNLVAQGTTNYWSGLTVSANTHLRGAGKGATIIKLFGSQVPDIGTGAGVSVIFNDVLTGGDENIVISDLTVDGNGANQTKLHNGITFIRTRGCKVERVRVKNVRGTGNTPPDETFFFDTQLGIDTTFVDCEAVGDAGTHGSGFSANTATNIKWVNCSARGMSEAHGFTAYQCVNPSWVSCWAYLNGGHGFNVEESLAPIFDSCHSGGEAALGTTPYPYSAGTSLGNTQCGFVINGSARSRIVNCVAHKNGDSGLIVVEGSASYGACSGRVVGCSFTNNAFAGVSMSTAATQSRWMIASDTVAVSNTTAQYDLPGGFVLGPGFGLTAAPAVPASTVELTNPYPFRVSVYLLGGDVSEVRINTNNVMSLTGYGSIARPLIRLAPGNTVALVYSSAPTWHWRAD